jgi:aminoethylphosphonate catabolism LysR family transcriptional regulator
MNLLHLRAFDMVVRTGSATGAAARLHVTQPAVTNHLKALEERYEVSLFTRSGRRLRPTPLGEQLAEISGRLFALEEDAVELLRQGQTLRGGTLRLASDGPYLLVPVAKAFRERFPGVRLSLRILNTQEVTAALLEERCDVAIQSEYHDDERLHATDIARMEIIVFVAASHPWAAQGRLRIDIAELDAQPVVIREPGSTTRRIFDEACAGAGVTPDYVLETTSRETVKEATAAGLGIGVIAENEFRQEPRLWPLRVEGAPMGYTDQVLCLNRRRSTRVVSEFLAVTDELVRSNRFYPGTDEADANR